MNTDDDDFWTTYIAVTPEEDADFAGFVPRRTWVVVALIIVAILAAIVYRSV